MSAIKSSFYNPSVYQRTDFFISYGMKDFYYRRQRGRNLIVTCAVFAVTVCLFLLTFWVSSLEFGKILYEKTYYFLARECTEASASSVAGQVYSSGGAGYYMQEGSKGYVVLACYGEKTDAEKVLRTLTEKGEEVCVLERAFSQTYLYADGLFRAKVASNLKTVESCAQLLYDTANGLERFALSQEQARLAVGGVAKALNGLMAEEDVRFFAWQQSLHLALKRANEIREGILFAKDVRYLQVMLCEQIVNGETFFA